MNTVYVISFTTSCRSVKPTEVMFGLEKMAEKEENVPSKQAGRAQARCSQNPQPRAGETARREARSPQRGRPRGPAPGRWALRTAWKTGGTQSEESWGSSDNGHSARIHTHTLIASPRTEAAAWKVPLLHGKEIASYVQDLGQRGEPLVCLQGHSADGDCFLAPSPLAGPAFLQLHLPRRTTPTRWPPQLPGAPASQLPTRVVIKPVGPETSPGQPTQPASRGVSSSRDSALKGRCTRPMPVIAVSGGAGKGET